MDVAVQHDGLAAVGQKIARHGTALGKIRPASFGLQQRLEPGVEAHEVGWRRCACVVQAPVPAQRMRVASSSSPAARHRGQ